MTPPEPYALLTVGAGPAALAAARAFRELRPEARVGMIADERRAPYMRPALSKALLRGEVTAAEILLDEEDALAAERIELIAGRAAAIDVNEHVVVLSGGRELPYQRCVLAPGAEPIRVGVPGAEDPAVRTLRSVEDVRELHARLRPGMRVVVVGSGFIGCEIATSLSALGHPVVMCSQESAPNAARLGDPAAAELARWLEASGVELALGAGLEAIERRPGELRVTTSRGVLSGGLVVMATGVTPRAELAAQAGAGLESGAVPTDARLRTGLRDLWAAGDVTRADHFVARRRLRIEHWGDALAQGTVAGRNAADEPTHWTDVPGFWSEIGGRTLKYAGWGDGYDELRWEPHADGFTAWYRGGDWLVGVLTHNRDADYERGRELIAAGTQWE